MARELVQELTIADRYKLNIIKDPELYPRTPYWGHIYTLSPFQKIDETDNHASINAVIEEAMRNLRRAKKI